MTDLAEKDLIYDWNVQGTPPTRPPHIDLDDETLRDGLQSPSVCQPSIETKKELLHLMAKLGIQSADIGLPGAGPAVVADVAALAGEIARHKLPIFPNCAGRTVEADVLPIIEISQKVGIPIEASLFLGSSPIRQYAEGWTLDRLLHHTESAVSLAVGHGLPVMFVTEDTTRSHPDTIRRLYTAAIRSGARRICVCDTVGHVTPNGVRELIRFVRGVVKEVGEDVKVDWHGHRDRGLSVPNSLAALDAGADRIHGAAIGIGERAGNMPMDTFLVNLKLLGWWDHDLSALGEYCRVASEACGVPIPTNYPVVGADAFETGTGVHAAAVIKAFHKGHDWLADRIYSGVPAGDFGLRQKIRIGPMSGKSNVIFWLKEHGYEPTDERVEKLFQAGKNAARLLKDEDLKAVLAT